MGKGVGGGRSEPVANHQPLQIMFRFVAPARTIPLLHPLGLEGLAHITLRNPAFGYQSSESGQPPKMPTEGGGECGANLAGFWLAGSPRCDGMVATLIAIIT